MSHHYFDRPHDGLPAGTISHPAAWHGRDFDGADPWLQTWTAEEIDELAMLGEQALAGVERVEDVTQAQFQPRACLPALKRVARELKSGRGFVLQRGLPVQAWGEPLASVVFWGIGCALGRPFVQNPQGELLGHVKDYGEEADHPTVRRYRTSGNIDFHCDGAEAVGLLCLSAAAAGGESRIASSVTVFNTLVHEQPQLAARLFKPMFLDRRDEQAEGAPPCSQLVPCAHADGVLRTFYHSEYFRSAGRHEGYALDAEAQALVDAYDEIGAREEVCLDMDLQPGDIQWVNNHFVVHARKAYRDVSSGGRHLLRLWLELADP